MRPVLRERLACPLCHGRLEERPASLLCPHCGNDFPFREGLPCFTGADGPPPVAQGAGGWGIGRRLNPPENFLKLRESERLSDFLARAGSGAVVLDIGAKHTFRRSPAANIIRMDISIYPGVEVLGDGHALPFLEGVFDGVICTHVFEHVRDPERVLQEILRVLRPQGHLYVETPFVWGIHGGGGSYSDYRRWTPLGLRQFLENGFERLAEGISLGPSAALAYALREYPPLLFAPYASRLYWGLRLATGWLTWPLRYLDYFMNRRKGCELMAAGFYFLGRKLKSPLLIKG